MSENRYTEKYWQAELLRAEKDLDDKNYTHNAEESIQVYEGEKALEESSRKLGIWWSVNQTVLPAYYAHTPKVEVQLRKKVGNDIARVGAIVAERNTQYSIDEHFHFDPFAQHALLDYLLTGRGVIRARYEANTVPKFYEYSVFQAGEGGFVDGQGKPFMGDPATIAQGKDGGYIVKEQGPELAGQRAYLERIHWRDYREQCGRQQSEVGWKSWRAYMTRDEAKELLGEETADKLKYTSYPEDGARKGESLSLYEGKAEVWEIWCEETGKVYIFSGAGNEAIVEPSDPPIRFADFYPIEVLGQNIRLNSNIPFSDYSVIKDQILEVERLTTRIHAGLAALKFNAAYDASIGNEIEKLFSGDLKLIPVKFPGYKGEQALGRMIEMNPLIAPIVQSLQVLNDSREIALTKIYEQTGSSDIIRGMTDPRETLGAQEIKNSRANWRFSFRQKQIQDWFGRAIGKMGEIICTQFAPETLYEVANGTELMPFEQFAPVADFLRSDPGRRYRIAIATDSMNAVDEAAEHKERTDLLSSCGAFLGQLDGIMQQHPSFAPVAMELMKFTVRTYKGGGKELEPVFGQAMQGIQQEIQAKANAPQQGAADAQVKLQVAQMQIQADQAKTQAQIGIEQFKLQIQSQTEQLKAQVEQTRIQLDAERVALEHSQHQVETALRTQELQLKAQEIQASTAAKINDTEINARMSELKIAVEAEKSAVERQRVQLEGYEKLIEEKRLSLEARTREMESVSAKAAEPKQPKLPNMVFNIDAKPSGKRTITKRSNPDGSTTYDANE